jgi:hypothetical protein
MLNKYNNNNNNKIANNNNSKYNNNDSNDIIATMVKIKTLEKIRQWHDQGQGVSLSLVGGGAGGVLDKMWNVSELFKLGEWMNRS